MSNVSPEEIARVDEIRSCGLVIPRKYLSVENDLMVSKWPGYRFMSPLAATKQFRLDYIKAYKNSHRINVDIYQADKLQISKKMDFERNNNHLTQIWLARQLADELGMPYPAYLEFCFDFAMRRRRKQPPQPNQLGPNKKTKDAWFAALEEYWSDDRSDTVLCSMVPIPQYFTANDRGLPAQRAFKKRLIEIGARPAGSFDAFFGHRVVALRQLSEADCISFRGADAVSSAIISAQRDKDVGILTVHTYPDLPRVGQMQACFGVPGIETATAATCAACRQIATCDALRSGLLKNIERKTSHADPLEAGRLAGIRARTKKCRAKARREKSERDPLA